MISSQRGNAEARGRTLRHQHQQQRQQQQAQQPAYLPQGRDLPEKQEQTRHSVQPAPQFGTYLADQ